MSDQPQFRTRVLPMPKERDEILWQRTGGTVESKPASRCDEKSFLLWIGTNAYRFTQTDANWCFADSAVEALRLMEAAWRADDSPLPEWIEQAIEQAKDLPGYEGPLGIVFIAQSIVKPDDVHTWQAEAMYQYLRWQAQQEQK